MKYIFILLLFCSCAKIKSDVYEFRFHSERDTCMVAWGTDDRHLNHYSMLNEHDYKVTVTLEKDGYIFAGLPEGGSVQLWRGKEKIIDSTNAEHFFILYKSPN